MSPSGRSAMSESWRERVIRARERRRFTDDDRRQAARWSTCAVGEHVRSHLMLIKLEYGLPVDVELGRLGTVFFAAVLGNDAPRAEAAMDIVMELERRRAKAKTIGQNQGRDMAAARHAGARARRVRAGGPWTRRPVVDLRGGGAGPAAPRGGPVQGRVSGGRGAWTARDRLLRGRP